MMPGGASAAWPAIKPIFQAIAAKVKDGTPCCDWLGEGGAGHFVKMVHNGIEYGDMQLTCESYDLMKKGLGMSAPEMSPVYEEWNKGDLSSFLIQITSEILRFKDEDGAPLVDHILDRAGQKGTGKWTVIGAMDLGIPLTMISEAVFTRSLSALKDERVVASKAISGPDSRFTGDRNEFTDDLAKAVWASKIISYTQGYMVFRAASKEFKWNLNFGGIAMLWREGCIIRSAFLSKIKDAFDRDPNLTNLLLDPYFQGHVNESQAAWRRVVGRAVALGIPVPAMTSALTFFDGYRSENLPANLLQAQRDYFGAHTFERTDAPRGKAFHANWTGHGGAVTAGTYSA
jgi:6-phosphogluconate dehydrogenase